MFDRPVVHHLERDVAWRHRVGDHADGELGEMHLNDRRSLIRPGRGLSASVHRHDGHDAEDERRHGDRCQHERDYRLGEERFFVCAYGVHR